MDMQQTNDQQSTVVMQLQSGADLGGGGGGGGGPGGPDPPFPI